MPTLPIKIATGVALTGAIGGCGIYGYYRLTDTTNSVEHYLKENKFKPVASSNEAFWTKVFETYKLEKTTETSIKEGELTDKNKIRDWCSTNLTQDIKSTEDALFKKASKWCVEYKTIKEALGGDTKFETVPTTLKQKYDTLKDPIKATIGQIVVSQSSDQEGHKVKKWCDDNSKRSSSEDNKTYTKDIKEICLKADAS